MRGAVASRALLILTLAIGLAGCGSGTPSPSGEPNGLMTVEQVRLEIEATKAKTPLPAGVVWRAIELGEGTYEAYAGGSMIEFQAMCAWLLEARDARAAGEQARFGRAVAILRQMPTWRLFIDPAMWDEGSRTTILDGLEAAVEGDFAPLGPFIQGNCLG